MNYNWSFHRLWSNIWSWLRLGRNIWLRLRLWSRGCQNFPTCCRIVNRWLLRCLRTNNWRVINWFNWLWVREETVTWRNNRCLLEQDLFGSLHSWLSRLRCINNGLWRKSKGLLRWNLHSWSRHFYRLLGCSTAHDGCPSLSSAHFCIINNLRWASGSWLGCLSCAVHFLKESDLACKIAVEKVACNDNSPDQKSQENYKRAPECKHSFHNVDDGAKYYTTKGDKIVVVEQISNVVLVGNDLLCGTL